MGGKGVSRQMSATRLRRGLVTAVMAAVIGGAAVGCDGDEVSSPAPTEPTVVTTTPGGETSGPVVTTTPSGAASSDSPTPVETETASSEEQPPFPEEVDGWVRMGSSRSAVDYVNPDDPDAEIFVVTYRAGGRYDDRAGQLEDERLDDVWYCGTTDTSLSLRRCDTDVHGGAITFMGETDESVIGFAERLLELWEWG